MESNGDKDMTMKFVKKEFASLNQDVQKIEKEKLYLIGESERHCSLRIQNSFQIQVKDFERFFYHFFDDVFSGKINLADTDDKLLFAIFRLGNPTIRKWMIEYFWKEYKTPPVKNDIFKFYYGLSFANINGYIFTQDLRIKPFTLERIESQSTREKKLYEDTLAIFKWLGLSDFNKNSLLSKHGLIREVDKPWLHGKVLTKLDESWSEIRRVDPKLKEETASKKKNSYSMFDHLVLRRRE